MILAGLVADKVAVEVTHRSARRLFGLAGMAPIRDVIIPPHRPEPGRGRGRPPFSREDAPSDSPAVTPVPLGRFEWPAIDYRGLDEAIADAEKVIRSTRRSLDHLATVRAPPAFESLVQQAAAAEGPEAF